MHLSSVPGLSLIHIYMNTTMDMVDSDGACIHCVQCYQMTTENRYEFGAKVFVDATGNGTLGYFAWAEYKICLLYTSRCV